MLYKYLKQLLAVVGITTFILAVVWGADETNKPVKEKDISSGEIINRAIAATFESAGFHFKGKGYFKVTAPNTNILIESTFRGVTKNPGLTHLTLESEETGEKVEVYRKGQNAVVKTNKTNEWVKQAIVSPAEFVGFYKDTLENIKMFNEEKLKDNPCQVIDATLNPDGINNLLALYKIGILPNAKKTSSVKIWIGKKDNLVYKIIVKIEINAENPPHPLDEDEENLPPDKRRQSRKTNVILNAGVLCFDYNKNIDIKIPEEVKKILEKNGNKK